MRFRRFRVTGGGVLFGLLLAATGAAAFLTANNLLFLLFTSMLALLLVSGFLNRLVLSGLEVELLLPEHVCARAATPARIRLRNVKRLVPSWSIALYGHAGDASMRRPVYFPVIAGADTVETEVELTFARRGRHRENAFVLSSRFPFGFIERATVVQLSRETLVYPALEPSEEAEAALWTSDSTPDFDRVREYAPGDSARHVDWKSTAHTGRLHVRVFNREDRRMVEVALEDRAVERRIEECAWLAWQVAENGYSIRFEASDALLDEPVAVLRYLATRPSSS